MTRVDNEQIAQLALSRGLTAQQATTAVAIALAESGGRDDARNPKTGTQGTGCVAYGLWQILDCPGPKWDVPYRRAVAASPANIELNADAMVAISNHGKSWGPWTTYPAASAGFMAAAAIAVKNVTSGGYVAPNANPALQGQVNAKGDGASTGPNWDPTGGAVSGAVSSVTGTIGDVLDVLKVLTASATWYRVGLFVLGLVAALFGLVMIERDTLEQAAVVAAL